MTELEKAVKVLIKHLKKDDSYFHSWQSNIAMSINDEFYRNKKEGRKLRRVEVCNVGAYNFLQTLINS